MPGADTSPFAEPDFAAVAPADAGDEPEDDLDEEYDEDLADEDEDDLPDGPAGELTADEDAGADDDLADEDDDGDERDVNRSEPDLGGTARAVLEQVARSIVDDPDQVEVEVSDGRSGVKLSLHVAQSDMGRIIGRRGRTAQALRTLVRAAAAHDGKDASVDIVD